MVAAVVNRGVGSCWWCGVVGVVGVVVGVVDGGGVFGGGRVVDRQ